MRDHQQHGDLDGRGEGRGGSHLTLDGLIEQVAGDRALSRRGFNKSELLALFAERLEGDPESAFARVRTAAKEGQLLGGLPVRTEGERRGMRYFFGEASGSGATRDRGAREAPPPSSGIRDFTVPGCPEGAGSIEVYAGDNLAILPKFPDASFDLIYIDPPFNTGRAQARTRLKTERDDEGDRVGFKGQRYRTTVIGSSSFADRFDDYLEFLVPRLEEAYRLLTPNGSFFLHLDYREVHYAKVVLDQIFGRDSFINEIIWSYDYGARSTNKWSTKHDNILWYAKNPKDYCFNYDEIDRIPYMAPSLVGEEKAARGKTPTDTWWNTIVSPTGKEKTGYPTQKPLGILTRIVRVHSRPGDRLLDFFAGSGSFGEAGAQAGRSVTLVDDNPDALKVMRRRFASYPSVFHEGATGDTKPLAGPPSQQVLF